MIIPLLLLLFITATTATAQSSSARQDSLRRQYHQVATEFVRGIVAIGSYDSVLQRTVRDDVIGPTERKLENGLRTFLAYEPGLGTYQVYGRHGIIIAVAAPAPRSYDEAVAFYNDTAAWREWWEEMIDPIDTLMLDTALCRALDVLLAADLHYPVGDGCGFIGRSPSGYCAAYRLFDARAIGALRVALSSPNVEGRAYALLALRRLKEMNEEGVEIAEDLDSIARWWDDSSLGQIAVCSGCEHWSESIDTVLMREPRLFRKEGVGPCP